MSRVALTLMIMGAFGIGVVICVIVFPLNVIPLFHGRGMIPLGGFVTGRIRLTIIVSRLRAVRRRSRCDCRSCRLGRGRGRA